MAIILVLLATAGNSAPPASVLQRIAWLPGCWELRSPDGSVEEQWMAPRGQSMIGVSRTVRADSLTAFEVIIIREQEGRLIFEAHPSGQPSAVFYMKSVCDTAVVFENPDHDFPQRIGYQQERPDSLLAWIEGNQNGQGRRIEFKYGRVKCPGD